MRKKKEEHSPIAGGDGDVCRPLSKPVHRFLRKVDIDLPREWFLGKVAAALPQD